MAIDTGNDTSSSSGTSGSGNAGSAGAKAGDGWDSTKDHFKRAADDIGKAAESMFDQMLPPDVRTHMRKAARHALQAAMAAIDEADRRAEAAAAERRQRDQAPPAAGPAGAP